MIICWSCGIENKIVDEKGVEITVNFCVNCGMKLKFNCPYHYYCKEIVKYSDKECHGCGGLFSRCEDCQIVFKLDETTCSECGKPTLQEHDIFQPKSVNIDRGNSFFFNNGKRFEIQSEYLDLEGQVSEIAVCNQNLVYWKSSGNRCRLYCTNAKTGEYAWRNNNESVNFNLNDLLYFEINESYILSYTKGMIFINKLSDGNHLKSIPVDCDYKAYMHRSKLYILCGESNEQYVLVYPAPFTVPEILTERINLNGERKNSTVLPVCQNDFIFFADYSGGISRLDVNDGTFKTVCEYKDRAEVEYMALHGDMLLFTLRNDENRTRSVLKISLNDGGRFRQTTIIKNTNLCLPKFSVHGDFIYVCDGMEDSPRFSRHIIDSYVEYSGKHKAANTRLIEDFYIVIEGDELYVLYKCKSNFGGELREIRSMNLRDGTEAETLKRVSPTRKVYFSNVYNIAVIAELDKGNVTFRSLN